MLASIAMCTRRRRPKRSSCSENAIGVPVPEIRVRPHFHATPSAHPTRFPIDLDIPVYRNCQRRRRPWRPHHHHGHGHGYGHGHGHGYGYGHGHGYGYKIGKKISSKKFTNAIAGNIIGSKVQMNNGGKNNTQAIVKTNVKKRNRRGRRGKGKKHGGKPKRGGRGWPQYPGCGKGRRPYWPGVNQDVIDVKKYTNQIQGHVIGSKVQMNNGGTDNIQAVTEKKVTVKRRRRGHPHHRGPRNHHEKPHRIGASAE